MSDTIASRDFGMQGQKEVIDQADTGPILMARLEHIDQVQR
jgi:hypothetical protein